MPSNLFLLADRVTRRERLAWFDSPPQTCDGMVLKPEVSRLDFILLGVIVGIVSSGADLGKRYFERILCDNIPNQ